MKRITSFSSNCNVSKMFKPSFLVTILCTCLSVFSYGQTTQALSGDSVSAAQRQYVKMEIGMNILDCPVLPKQLKEKLSVVKGIQDYQEDVFTQSIYFNIPAGAITKEQIAKVAAACAFPPNSVKVLMAEKQFAK